MRTSTPLLASRRDYQTPNTAMTIMILSLTTVVTNTSLPSSLLLMIFALIQLPALRTKLLALTMRVPTQRTRALTSQMKRWTLKGMRTNNRWTPAVGLMVQILGSSRQCPPTKPRINNHSTSPGASGPVKTGLALTTLCLCHFGPSTNSRLLTGVRTG